MKTPEILWPAIRQYRHNNSDEFICGFDRDETIKIITKLEARVSELEKALREIENIRWGWDGDCGAQQIINRVLD